MAPPSDKSRTVALILSIFLGWAGAHRFYVGKIGTGLLMLCTFGGLGIWYLYDLITIAGGSFTDVDGRRLRHWDPEAADAAVPDEVLDELDALRREVAELAERMDFTERLLARGGRSESESPAEARGREV
ncbi:MAG TPA: TM2 domain-containing protein [Gemmatimonadales bacterium]